MTSENRKERWASTITLGRLKDERAFAFLPSLLLEGFSVFGDGEQLQEVQEAFRCYRRTIKEQGGRQAILPAIWMDLCLMDYEWYLCQRSECALLLGAWGNPVVVPKLCEALQAAWKMEQEWPDYIGEENACGPTMWYFFQDSLTFALGQLGAWDALSAVAFPEKHLCIAQIYLALGALQGNDSSLFYKWHNVFRYAPEAEIYAFVESAPIRRFLAEHFAVSETEQEGALLRWPHIWYERARESGFLPLPYQWQEGGQPGPYGILFDPFFDSDTLP